MTLIQPARGFRSSLDPLLLASFTAPPFGRFVDIGCGTGAVAFLLASADEGSSGVGVEIQPRLARFAAAGAARNPFASRVAILHADARAAVGRDLLLPAGAFDLVASNPPYIAQREAGTLAREVVDHEPAIALFGGDLGYEFYADLISRSATHLKPGGILVLELGHDSLPAVQPLLDAPAWTNIGVANDLAGIPRVLSAEHTPT